MHNTVASFGPRWTCQGVENAPIIVQHPPVFFLDDAFKGVPAIIVGPGPSLDKNIDQLHKAKGKAIIFAYARALQQLVNLDPPLYPDFVVVLDPLDLDYQWTQVDPSKLGALVPGITCHPKLYRMGAQRMFPFSGNHTIESWLYEPLGGDKLWLATSCGVATTTTSLAVRMGCDPICYVGQDLAFPKGRLYASGTVDGGGQLGEAQGDDDTNTPVHGMSKRAHELTDTGQALLTVVPRLVKVPGYYGGKVKTQPSFAWTRDWMADTIADNKDRTWCNATEGGCHLPGALHKPLHKVIAQYMGPDAPDVDTRAVMDRVSESYDPGPPTKALLERCQLLLKSANAAERAARMLKADLLHGQGSLSTMEYHRRIRRFETWIARKAHPANLFMSLCQVVEGDAIWEHAEKATTMLEMYKAALGVTELIQRSAYFTVIRLQRTIAQLRGEEPDYHAQAKDPAPAAP